MGRPLQEPIDVASIDYMGIDVIDVTLSQTFRTNMKVIDSHRNVLVRIRCGRTWGHGEAYAMDIDSVVGELRGLSMRGEDLWQYRRILRQIPTPAARCAVDTAVMDLLSKRARVPLHKWLGLSRHPLTSSVSIGVASEDAVIEKARELVAKGYDQLKLKMAKTTPADLALRVREAVGDDVGIRVDANQSWSPQRALEVIPLLERAQVELIEQPMPVGYLAKMRDLRVATCVPLYLDEEIVGPVDVVRAARTGAVDGINVKLSKCGGLSGCLETILAARAHGMRVMFGCHFETSLGITAAAHLALMADLVDLDAPLFLSHDPFEGIRYQGCRIFLPERAGVGAVRRAA